MSLFQTFLATKIEDRLEARRPRRRAHLHRASARSRTRWSPSSSGGCATGPNPRSSGSSGFRIRLDVPLEDQQIREPSRGRALVDAVGSSLDLRGPLPGSSSPSSAARIVSLIGECGSRRRCGTRAASSSGRTEPWTGFAGAPGGSSGSCRRTRPSIACAATVRAAERALAATFVSRGRPDARRPQPSWRDELRKPRRRSSRPRCSPRAERFLLDSDLVGEDVRIAVSYCERPCAAEAERGSRRRPGCRDYPRRTEELGDKGVTASAATCPPSFTMESLQSLPPYGR